MGDKAEFAQQNLPNAYENNGRDKKCVKEGQKVIKLKLFI